MKRCERCGEGVAIVELCLDCEEAQIEYMLWACPCCLDRDYEREVQLEMDAYLADLERA